MLERGLLPDFSAAALKQAHSITAPAMERGAAVRDLRALLWASIDNDDSRDLDQLSVAQPLPDGAVRVWIAIADVDALVQRGSPIDDHARSNTTSVYTVAQIFPMLPEKLSTDLTSLAESQERLAVVIEMTIDANGAVTASDVYRAVVLNRAKLAYDSVAAWLDGAAAPPARLAAVSGLDQQLRLQDRAAQSLKRLRHVHGALGLETIEARPVFDGELLRDLRPDENNRAKELIEDFMIAANGVSARFLASHGLPSLRRVLRAPQRWDRIVALAAGFGDPLPPAPSAAALNEFLIKRRQADATGFPDISLAVIKLLGRGEYALDLPGGQPPGHFGLAVQDYTHSTAPNRRFPDVITQRLLKAALSGRATDYTSDELARLAAHCTSQEDNAAKVERQLRKSAAALLLAPRIGQHFDAVVTGASIKGTWVRIRAPTAEGKLFHGYEGLDVGDHVRVTLVQTDVERGFIDFKSLG
ncbi:MAG TPA: RNB domain-containing ribonuclease [Steroidobacteraceae bacterium]|nr:RNB domain-containing ribonuclease [Steroidobacteraceae bacterium]